jgi:hypothetical protein
MTTKAQLTQLAERVMGLTPFHDYFVSENGDVWSVKRGKPVRLSPTLTEKGYRKVCLIIDGRLRTLRVNRIVCEAFHGPPPSRDHVARHLDGNPSNDAATNLAWGTQSENARDALRHGTQSGARNSKATGYKRRGDNAANAKLSEAQVAAIKRRLILGERQFEIAADYGVNRQMIYRIAHGKDWGHVVARAAECGE